MHVRPLPATVELSGHIRANSSRKQQEEEEKEEWGRGAGEGVSQPGFAHRQGQQVHFKLKKKRFRKKCMGTWASKLNGEWGQGGGGGVLG